MSTFGDLSSSLTQNERECENLATSKLKFTFSQPICLQMPLLNFKAEDGNNKEITIQLCDQEPEIPKT
jgi:hypothetical protein